MNTTRQSPHSRAAAFTLAELMVVVTVIVLLLTIIVPSVSNMLGSGRITAARDLMGSVAASARSVARLKPPFSKGEYAGSAIVVTATDLRVAKNINPASAKDGSSTGPELNSDYFAYRDADNYDYVQIPEGVGVIGISRGGSIGSGKLKLLSPPFTIRFNPSGAMFVINNNSDPATRVLYDGDYNGGYSPNKDRDSTTFDPDEYDPESSVFKTSNYASGGQEHDLLKLPIEALDSVAGVILYDKKAFNDSFPNGLVKLFETTSTFAANTEGKWLMDNGTIIFFNRYSGAVISP